jgi:hypothetical protein
MEWFPVLKGLATYIPFLYKAERGTTGGSVTARYCYSIWLRHLVCCARAGLPTDPVAVGEIGPGDSLGTGLAALLTGASSLHALDVVRYASTPHNEVVLDELVRLFRERAPIPGEDELPGVFPPLQSYEFPRQMLSEGRLTRSLAPLRIEEIRKALRGEASAVSINYVVPWVELAGDVKLDLVISQAVLEHVADLESTYAALARYVRVGGGMSHVIDFRSHRLTKAWDGHLQYSPMLWQLVKGRRPYLLNRAPLSRHMMLLAKSAFDPLPVVRGTRFPELPDANLAHEFRDWSDEDRTTTGALVQSVRRGEDAG